MFTLFIPIIAVLFVGFFFAETLRRFSLGLEGLEIIIASAVAVIFFIAYFTHFEKFAVIFLAAVFVLTLVLKIIDMIRNREKDEDDW
ncbi:MAG: hypothetical protein J6S40_09610 [Thermoguttaceae bacterium]|nr:hypothetical protein [Thermoguttaceae bacterium]